MSLKIISAHPIFTENALMVSKRFNIEIEKDFNPKEGDLYIVFGAHEVAPTLYMTQQNLKNKIGYIIYNTEQINSSHWRNKYYISLCRDNPVYNYSNHIAQEIKEKYKIVPYSFFFFEFLCFDKSSVDIKENYDITFIGAKNDFREKIMNEIIKEFSDKNIYVDFEYKNNNPLAMTTTLMSSKIVLNIPFYKNNTLETHRINKALSCGCKVISLKTADEDAYEFYKDYVYFTDNIVESLKDETFLSEPKKTYEMLVKELGVKFTAHNIYVAKQIHTKLLSNINTNETKTD
jgi:hypothetical protein